MLSGVGRSALLTSPSLRGLHTPYAPAARKSQTYALPSAVRGSSMEGGGAMTLAGQLPHPVFPAALPDGPLP